MRKKHLITDDGSVLQIRKMYRPGGEETEDPALARAIVVELPDGRFSIIECAAGALVPRPVLN